MRVAFVKLQKPDVMPITDLEKNTVVYGRLDDKDEPQLYVVNWEGRIICCSGVNVGQTWSNAKGVRIHDWYYVRLEVEEE